MLGKRFRRTTSMSHLGPGCQVVGNPASDTTPEKIQGANTTPHPVQPPKAARPWALRQADVRLVDVNMAADARQVDVNMAVAAPVCDSASSQRQRPCQMNEGSCAVVCCDALNMEVMVPAYVENQSSSIVCYGDVSMKAGFDCANTMLVEGRSGMMQVEYGGMMQHSLMPYQMGLWTHNSSIHFSHGKGKLEQQQQQPISPVDFLDVCFYCKRRLRHERDIFIYRGDTAFCSEECRHRQIVNDERRSTRATSKRGGARASSSSSSSSSSSETAVAA